MIMMMKGTIMNYVKIKQWRKINFDSKFGIKSILIADYGNETLALFSAHWI